ncbi:MAG: flippase-like domain-containing protein [Candidatus Sumerlaeaceae bacterium]|nr:flippase-like domain-containing protein [Candidatus Sumerlaeaceae bacterium]
MRRSKPYSRTAAAAWGAAARAAAAAALLIGVFRFRADLGETARIAAAADGRWLGLAFAVMIAGEGLTAWKWRYLLRKAGHPVPVAAILRASAAGVFYGLFLPGSIGGDIARTLSLAVTACGRAVALASVFMQRNTGLAGLLVLANAAVWIHPVALPGALNLPRAVSDLRPWFAAVTGGYLAVNCLLSARLTVSALQRVLFRLGAVAGSRPVRAIWRLHHAYIPFLRAVPVAVLFSVVSQLTDCLIAYILGRALGMSLPFTIFCIAVPSVTLLSLLPLSVGGLGIREVVYLSLLTGAGADLDAAVALGLVHFLLVFTLSVCCGGYLLLRRGGDGG